MEELVSEIQPNTVQEIFSKYSKELRNMPTEKKVKIMIAFVKKELGKLRSSEQVTLKKFKEEMAKPEDKRGSLNTALLERTAQERANMERWLGAVEHINLNDDEDKGFAETVFVHSIMHTDGFRKFAKNFKG